MSLSGLILVGSGGGVRILWVKAGSSQKKVEKGNLGFQMSFDILSCLGTEY